MTAEIKLTRREGDHWWRGFGPLARRENRKWWRSRRWLVQLVIWVGLLDGLLAFALYVLPRMAAANGEEIGPLDALDAGRQMFFGLGVLALSFGAIILLQDAFIDEKNEGTAAWVLSKPVSRPAYFLAKLLPNLLGMFVVMLLVPGVIGYALFWSYDPQAVTLAGFLASEGIVALNLLFYVALVLFLGVVLRSRAPLLGVAIGSIFAGSLLPLPAVLQFTPFKLGEISILPAMGQPLPDIGVTMVASTAVWIVALLAAAVWRLDNLEF